MLSLGKERQVSEHRLSGAIGLLEQKDIFGDFSDAIAILKAAESADKISMTRWLNEAEGALRSQHGDFRSYLDALPGAYFDKAS